MALYYNDAIRCKFRARLKGATVSLSSNSSTTDAPNIMSDRMSIPTAIETNVLTASARRCALCFGFNGDLTRKRGQIAHIDQIASNAEERNLVYLCVEHHDEYDSITSQVKGITQQELRAYKELLAKAIANGDHLRPLSVPSATAVREDAIRGHDERLFRVADDLLPERLLREFLGTLQSDDSYEISRVRPIRTFRDTFTETGNQFIDADLSAKLRVLLASIDALLEFLARHFFVFPLGQQRDDTRLCMHPNLNVDREGTGEPESMARYDRSWDRSSTTARQPSALLTTITE